MSLKFRKDLNRRLTSEEVDANFEYVGQSKSYGQTNIVRFDRLAGDAGSWDNPITGDLVVDFGSEENGNLAVNGGCFVVIWSGSSNPNLIGAGGRVNYVAGNITVQGTYSIYFHYLLGKININILGVDGAGPVPPPDGPETPQIVLIEPYIPPGPNTPEITNIENSDVVGPATPEITLIE